MKPVIFYFLMLFLIFCDITPINGKQAPDTDEDEIVGAYNHLTLCFALVRNGLQVESIRRDILGNVKLASLSPEQQQLYRSLLKICDKALVQKEKIARTESLLSDLNEQKEQAEMQRDLKTISSFLLSKSHPLLMLFELSQDVPDNSEQMQTAVETIRAMKAAIAQEVSDFEFQLSIERSKLIQGNSALSQQLITTAQVDEYLDLQSDQDRPKSYISSLELIYQRNPAMYFVAYELGKHAFSGGRLTAAQQCFESTINNSPSILNCNPIRVDAYCFLGDILAKGKEYEKALNQYSKALEEDRGSTHGLSGKAEALYHLKKYTESRHLYEKCIRIQPEDATTRYNYTCLLALTGAEQSLALDELKRAFNSGFTNIRLAKSDSDLASLRDSQDFRELTKMTIGYDVTWNILAYDILLLSNRSEFDWTNVTINVKYLEQNSQDWKSIVGQTGIKRNRLHRGETLSINAFDSTKSFLKFVELNISTDQGSRSVSFQNNSGRLQVIDTESK